MSTSSRAGRLVLAALVLCGAPATAQEDREGLVLRALAYATRAKADVPALGCMVMRAGGEPEIAVDGVRLAGGEAAVKPGDAWHWGSVTKSMTATLVARLVEKGVVGWDDTVGEHLFELVPDMELDLGDATFRHLLSHHAGLAANIPIPRFGAFGQDPQEPVADRLEWVEIALTQDPIGTPGETYAYSNNGYIVAGAMLEAATGTSWEELMRREVFEPLGIEHAGFGAPPGDAPRGHVAADEGDRPAPPNADNPAALGPAGRVHMPLADMARYLSAHARRDPEFLSAESWDTLHTKPFTGFYALGWVVTGENGRFHNGSNTMWYAEVAFDLETGAVAAVAVNDGDLATVVAPVNALLGKLLKGED
jgi:CubicO group peptidase (beta-lactamase class C family)